MNSPFLGVEEEIEAAKSIPGVIDFENNKENNFQLLTLEEGTEYLPIIHILYNEKQVEHRKLFICIRGTSGDKYIMPHDDPHTYEQVTINAVTAQRYSGRLLESLAAESGGKRPSFEDLLEPTTDIPPSPHQIVAALEGMNPTARNRYLALHPENLHLWNNKDDYLQPIA